MSSSPSSRARSAKRVYVGAGGLGRKIAQALPPICFADSLLTGTVDGIPVWSWERAVQEHPDAEFVVTIWGAHSAHRIRRTEDWLRSKGVQRIGSFGTLLEEAGLTHYCAGVGYDPVQGERKAGLFVHDPASLNLYLRNHVARSSKRFGLLPEPEDCTAYFGTGLFTFRDDEVIVDGGAYDGDTLRSWLSFRRPHARYVAFEPQVVPFERLMRVAGLTPQVLPVNAALGMSSGHAMLEGSGVGATVRGSFGAVVVETVDRFVPDATLIKLDIEGAELDAIDGAAHTIRTQRPVVIAAGYHTPNHLWQVPTRLARTTTDYRLFLRAHDAEGWDTFCYAVPEERCR